jgi:hypothetical protein
VLLHARGAELGACVLDGDAKFLERDGEPGQAAHFRKLSVV